MAGLPKGVAISRTSCGGDGTSVVSWDVRVRSFEMDSSGTDRAVYYAATRVPVRITINRKDLTVGTARADRVYNATTAATVSDFTLTGAVGEDDVRLNGTPGNATFADATPGVNKPVTLDGDVALAGGDAVNYTLTNPGRRSSARSPRPTRRSPSPSTNSPCCSPRVRRSPSRAQSATPVRAAHPTVSPGSPRSS